MKCFVASAFERQDVDDIYDRCVLPTLRALSITPYRVDRVEHNEDIDDKIIELLGESDFVIADLTYARPSVHFEAGYAAGQDKPIVYISRSDHLKARDSDPDGLLRVHFDLQMKNIIPWSEPTVDFTKRLEKRLRHVLKPLFRRDAADRKLQAERTQFQRLSQSSELRLLRAKARALLRVRSFSFPKLEAGWGILSWSLVADRQRKRINQEIAVFFTHSAVKKTLERIEGIGPFVGRRLDAKLPLDFHWIVVSLKPVPRDRLTQVFADYETRQDGTMYRRYERRADRPQEVFVHVVDSVKSVTEFAEDFRATLARHDLDGGAGRR